MGTRQSTISEEQNVVSLPRNISTDNDSTRSNRSSKASYNIRKKGSKRRTNKMSDETTQSSNSESDVISGYSYSSSKKSNVRRNHSNIRPPLLLFTNLNKRLENNQKRVNFRKNKSNGSTTKNAVGARESSDNTDLEEEINMILNDTKDNRGPWYRDPENSSSSSTVSIKSPEEDSISMNADLYSSRSLPTPSVYLYLSFDYNMKKSKTIEVLDSPNYFFMNYDEDTARLDSDNENNIDERRNVK